MYIKYKIEYFPAAKIEYKEARHWYSLISSNLEKRFITAIKNAFIELNKNPKAYGIRYKNIRIIHPKKFPFNIHFYISEEIIVIVAIIHNRRNPEIVISRV